MLKPHFIDASAAIGAAYPNTRL